MVRVIKASTDSAKDTNRKFTAKPSGSALKGEFSAEHIVALLQTIKELNGLEISYDIQKDGSVSFLVGDTVYDGLSLL